MGAEVGAEVGTLPQPFAVLPTTATERVTATLVIVAELLVLDRAMLSCETRPLEPLLVMKLVNAVALAAVGRVASATVKSTATARRE